MNGIGRKVRRRFLAPEITQTSSLDCGPAALRSALLGHGIDVNFERLRDACQTDVDGTSIDALESVARELGLAAEQIWLPIDHLTSRSIDAFPAMVMVRLPNGLGHVVIVWRRLGPFYQVMDPGSGRRWMTAGQLRAQVYCHDIEAPADTWRAWASSGEFESVLAAQLRALGADAALLGECAADESPVSLACLDAATRMVGALVRSRGLVAGPEAARVIRSVFERARQETRLAIANGKASARPLVPASFWSAVIDPTRPDRVRLRGAIAIRYRGVVPPSADREGVLSERTRGELTNGEVRPFHELGRVLREGGLAGPRNLAFVLVGAALLAPVEALFLRGLLDLGSHFRTTDQRLVALGLFVFVVLAAAALDLWTARTVRTLGRHAELRLRAKLLAHLPGLPDVYFRTRPPADMAHRAHMFHPVRELPALAARAVRLGADLIVTVLGLAWLDRRSLPLALTAAAFALIVPNLGRRVLVERDHQVRVHGSRLAQFCLDALLGATAIRAHGAERAVRTEHGSTLVEWVAALRSRLQLNVAVELVFALVSVGLSVAMIGAFVGRESSLGALLLFAYWALALPAIGQELGAIARAVPRYQNLLARLIEPLSASAEARAATAPPTSGVDPADPPPPLGVRFEGVTLRASGRALLEDVSLDLAPGEHVAIVGASGAGKSTLVSLLLGVTTPSTGRIVVDGEPLDAGRLPALRAATAWLDPTVALWNRSVLENVGYGNAAGRGSLAEVLGESEVFDVLDRLPHGLQSSVGESGKLLSGGEGQRVRLARAMGRRDARLVLLDEPFRGLARDARRRLMTRTRNHFADATLVSVTHDVGDTLSFDKIVVIADGRVVEVGTPATLRAAGGRFAEMLRAEEHALAVVWGDERWRRVHMAQGRLGDDARAEAAE